MAILCNLFLHNTEELCLIAIKKTPHALKHIVHKTRNLYIEAVKNRGQALEYIPVPYRDSTICYEAVKSYGNALCWVPDSLKTEELFSLAINNAVGVVLHLIPSEDKTYELCLKAVNKNAHSLKHVPEELQTPEMCLIALQSHDFKTILKYVKIVPNNDLESTKKSLQSIIDKRLFIMNNL